MGISKQQATQNREAIIAAAEKLFREKGVDGIGLNDLMDAAGFTRGGFYNHFKSKDALVAAVMDKAMQGGAADLEANITGARAKRRDPLDAEIEFYLSPQHRADIEGGCPISGFAGDVRRLDEATRKTFAQGLDANIGYFTALVAAPGDSPAAARAKAIATFSEMLGALVLSRAVAATAPALSNEILDTERKSLRAAAKARRNTTQAGQ